MRGKARWNDRRQNLRRRNILRRPGQIRVRYLRSIRHLRVHLFLSLMRSPQEELLRAAQTLAADAGRLRFGPPVTHVYNPLEYAWAGQKVYLERYSRAPAEIVFVGMNPGPFGMAQTGVPFGEIA